MSEHSCNENFNQQPGESITATYNIVENMFSETISKSIIMSIVKNCEGDLTEAVDTLLKISDNAQCQRESGKPLEIETEAKVLSYADLAKSKRESNLKESQHTQNKTREEVQAEIIPEELWEVVNNYKNGHRNMILMRGLPGSGKSYFSKSIINFTTGTNNYSDHIFSADDCFIVNGIYQYSLSRLGEAHERNQRRVIKALSDGVSPVIVDNTNVKIWEMYNYIKPAIANGYIISILTPNTPWAWKPHILAKKNIHGVPIQKLRYMINNFEPLTNIKDLLKNMNLSYPPKLTPPVLRNFPPILNEPEPQSSSNSNTNTGSSCSTALNATMENLNANSDIHNISMLDEELRRKALLEQRQKELEEIEKATLVWESGPDWEDSKHDEKSNCQLNLEKLIPKPRNQNFNLDWDKICDSLPDWNHDNFETVPTEENVKIETKEASTQVEPFFFEELISFTSDVKVLNANFRDINFDHVPKSEKIPNMPMLDKGTTTDDLEQTFYKDSKYFEEFRSMFLHIREDYLRDVFEKCYGDLNWAVEIVLDGVNDEQIGAFEEAEKLNVYESSQNKGDADNIDKNQEETRNASKIYFSQNEVEASTSFATESIKSKKNAFEDALKAKLHVEQNIDFGDEHYSEHCLKIKNMKKGKNLIKNKSDNNQSLPLPEDDVSSDTSSDQEEYINLNLAGEIVTQLHNLFGTPGNMQHADQIVPIISAPKSLLSQLYALWMESLAHQTEMQDEYARVLMKEDEELARKLTQQEEELEQQGKEEKLPDLKEIMDMEFALNVYNENVAQWKDALPQSIAFKMTKEKLCRLFPEISPDVMVEILLAHDNNFQKTIEALLVSTGQADRLTEMNAVTKFVAETEMANQKKFLQKEQERLKEEEWPGLCGSKQTQLSTVNAYRDEAQVHLKLRNRYYDKATEYFNKGMPQVASTYSQIATLHRRKYEHANHMAASSLIQFHSANTSNDTMDLHFMFVPEALQVLDLFLDNHIHKLKEDPDKKRKSLFLITGRGLHSKGGPRVKPAVIKRLKQRGFLVKEINPGLVKVNLTADFKLTYELDSN